ALAITDECSLAGVVRAHVAAQACALPLIIGSTLALQRAAGLPPLRLVLLAQNREGYGNLSELITLGRSRAPKGAYRLLADDIAAPGPAHAHLCGMPGCLAILAPADDLDAGQLTEQAHWLARTFAGRAWIGLTLLHHARDDLRRAAAQQA